MNQISHPIVVCEHSGSVAILRRADGAWRRSPIAPKGMWPAWNPTRDLLAISVVEVEDGVVTSSIDVVDLEGRTLRTLHRGPRGVPPVIAPRLPHYCMWSPQGDVLSYVARTSYGLTLCLSDLEGLHLSDPIINGAPIFSTWCPDNNFLAVHAGNELAVVETQGSRVTAEVTPEPAGFRTPAYSDDGEILAYAAQAEGSVAIMRSLFQGTSSREVWRYRGGVALAFRPGSQELSVAVAKDPESGHFDELWLHDLAAEGAPGRRIARGPFASCFWSPSGDSLALVVPLQSGDGRYAVRAHSHDGAFIAATEGFVPSTDYRTVLGFFDQYRLSHSLWSPDGRLFLVAGRPGGDAVSGAFGDPAGSFVFSWTASRGSSLEIVAPGEIGFFPPRALDRPGRPAP